MKKCTLTILLVMFFSFCFAQHIQYRDKSKPRPAPADDAPVQQPVKPVAKPVAAISKTQKTDTSISKNEPIKIKRKMPELITGCKLSSDTDKVAKLPIVINDVPAEVVAKLKERYKNRIYSITGLNMLDVRLKLKLRICDKDGDKFRIEYLDKDGNVVKDPNLDYYEF